MPSLETLLADCAAHPDDDARRLVWADAIGGERGELVVAQCALEAGVTGLAESGRLRRRVRQLLEDNGPRWAGLGSIASALQFRRGFVSAARLTLASTLAHGDELGRAAPLLRSLTVTDLGGPLIEREEVEERKARCLRDLEQLLSHPLLRRLRALALGPATIAYERDSEFNPYGSHSFQREADLLASRSGRLRHLVGASLVASSATVPLIARSYTLANLTHVQLDVTSSDVPVKLVEQLEAVRSLSVSAPIDPALIPSTVTELRLSSVDDASLARLAETPLASRLERLTLHHSQLVKNAAPLAAFTRLRSLDLNDFDFGTSRERVVTTLAAVRLPEIRELRCTDLDAKSAPVLARAWGSQLELLDLRGSHLVDREVIAPLVAGDVVVGGWVDSQQLFSAEPLSGPLSDPAPVRPAG